MSMNDFNGNGIPDHMEQNPYIQNGYGGHGMWGMGGGYGGGGDGILDTLVSAIIVIAIPLAIGVGALGYGTKWVDERYGTHYWDYVRELLPGEAVGYIERGDTTDGATAPTIYIHPKP